MSLSDGDDKPAPLSDEELERMEHTLPWNDLDERSLLAQAKEANRLREEVVHLRYGIGSALGANVEAQAESKWLRAELARVSEANVELLRKSVLDEDEIHRLRARADLADEIAEAIRAHPGEMYEFEKRFLESYTAAPAQEGSGG